MLRKGTSKLVKGLKENREVLTTTTTVTSNSSILKFKSNNVFPPMEIKFSSRWKHCLPDSEESTKVENLDWSDSHEKAFKELTSLTSKMDLSTKNMDKISYLLNTGDESLIKDLFETNKELFLNEGELAKLLLEIGSNVPMKDFNSYLIEEVKVDPNKMNSLQSWTWPMPSKRVYIKKIIETFPESKRDFYKNLSSPSFFNKLYSNNLLRDKAEVWAILENFKSNNPSLRSKSAGDSFKNEVLSGGSGNKTAPNTPVSCDGTIDEIVLKLFSSQPKLFNNNFALLRELTGLDSESFGFLMSLFRNRLTGKSQEGIDFILTYPKCNYSGEIYDLLKNLGEVRPCYGEKSTLITKWVDVKCNFKEVVPSLLEINDDYFDNIDNLDDFRLVKSQKANDIFNLRFKSGVTNPSDVEWWKDFNQLCFDIKLVTACQNQWATLSHEQKQILGSVYLGKNRRLKDFMTHDISTVRYNLEKVLQDICQDAPFNKQYLLDNHWCYSEYSNLLEENNITLKDQLHFVSDLNNILTMAIQFKSESVEERVKVKYRIANYIYDKGLIHIWFGSACGYFIARVSGGF